jgi:hypothetical protein
MCTGRPILTYRLYMAALRLVFNFLSLIYSIVMLVLTYDSAFFNFFFTTWRSYGISMFQQFIVWSLRRYILIIKLHSIIELYIGRAQSAYIRYLLSNKERGWWRIKNYLRWLLLVILWVLVLKCLSSLYWINISHNDIPLLSPQTTFEVVLRQGLLSRRLIS